MSNTSDGTVCGPPNADTGHDSDVLVLDFSKDGDLEEGEIREFPAATNQAPSGQLQKHLDNTQAPSTATLSTVLDTQSTAASASASVSPMASVGPFAFKVPRLFQFSAPAPIAPLGTPARPQFGCSGFHPTPVVPIAVATPRWPGCSNAADLVTDSQLSLTVGRSDHVSRFRTMLTHIQPVIKHNNGWSDKEAESYKNAPIFSSDVPESSYFTQYGLIGAQPHQLSSDGMEIADASEEDLVLVNMDVPWSAFICGSQGAGKSHTLSCLLENALIDNETIGRNPNPLAGMVFHYDNYTSAYCTQVCEAAYLCTSGIPVTVLVAPSNIWAMKAMYENLPGLPFLSQKPKVLPLYLSEDMLNVGNMLKLMAIGASSDHVPLYMETVMGILREMAMEGNGAGKFSYVDFRNRLDAVKWVPGQLTPLAIRLQLLDSFLKPTQFTQTTRPAPAQEDIWAFGPGTLTIVDLSDPFVSSADACMLFSICLSLFMEGRGECGRVVALDEAHKFLTQSGPARALTTELTSVIRQQRHTGTRVLIATQEPTLSPDIIDLANVTFVHRFISPAWFDVLRRHLAGASKHESDKTMASLFDSIVNLDTGDALVFCPTALIAVESDDDLTQKQAQKLGDAYLRVVIRKRLTADGGRSMLASEKMGRHSITDQTQVPMHIVKKKVEATQPSNDKGRAMSSMTTATHKRSASRGASPPPKKPNTSMQNNATTTLQPTMQMQLPAYVQPGVPVQRTLPVQPTVPVQPAVRVQPTLPVQQSVPVRQSAPVQQTVLPQSVAQPLIQPQSKLTRVTMIPWIEYHSRRLVRQYRLTRNWQHIADWDLVIHDLESALGFTYGTLRKKANQAWYNAMMAAATSEMTSNL